MGSENSKLKFQTVIGFINQTKCNLCAFKMPGRLKVRIMGSRNLPIMDKSSDTSDAFVEVRIRFTLLFFCIFTYIGIYILESILVIK